jgi:flagellar basal body-associated protein FliL
MTFKTFPEDISKKKKDSKLVFIIKAVTWFIATVAGGVWVSTFISGCGI